MKMANIPTFKSNNNLMNYNIYAKIVKLENGVDIEEYVHKLEFDKIKLFYKNECLEVELQILKDKLNEIYYRRGVSY